MEGVNNSILVVKDDEDNTKKYEIIGSKDEDIRKKIFTEFAKEGITILSAKTATTIAIVMYSVFMKVFAPSRIIPDIFFI